MILNYLYYFLQNLKLSDFDNCRKQSNFLERCFKIVGKWGNKENVPFL